MKNILIPTDFSENAWNAIEYALALFKKEECNIHLLNTYTPAIASSRFMAASVENGMFENAAKRTSKKGLKNLVDRIKRDFNNPKHSFKTTSSFSFLVDEIKEVLDNEEIDCIVMGTKGASGLQEVFMGTHTVKVIRAIRNCPVFVIPENFCPNRSQYNQLVLFERISLRTVAFLCIFSLASIISTEEALSDAESPDRKLA